MTKSPVAGEMLNEYLLSILQAKNITVKPSFSFKKKITNDTPSIQDLSFPQTTASFAKFAQLVGRLVLCVCARATESVCLSVCVRV